MAAYTEVSIEVCIIPVATEINDIRSIADANDLCSQVRHSFATTNDITVRPVPTTERSGDLIEVVRTVLEHAYDHRTELTNLISMALTALTALASQRRIDEIEVTMDSRTVKLKGVDVDHARHLIHKMIPNEPGEALSVKPRVTARTRKRRL